LSEKYITIDGAKELLNQEEMLKSAILAYARVIAFKEERLVVDQVHIKKAAALVKNPQSSHSKWFVSVSIAVLLSFAILQLGVLYVEPSENILALWILPIVVFLWIAILSYIFRDFS
jgi:hypothetical protein